MSIYINGEKAKRKHAEEMFGGETVDERIKAAENFGEKSEYLEWDDGFAVIL